MEAVEGNEVMATDDKNTAEGGRWILRLRRSPRGRKAYLAVDLDSLRYTAYEQCDAKRFDSQEEADEFGGSRTTWKAVKLVGPWERLAKELETDARKDGTPPAARTALEWAARRVRETRAVVRKRR